MGVDLTFCPDGHDDSLNWHLAYDRLGTDRDSTFQEAVQALKPLPLASTVRFQWYNDGGLEVRTTDPYGEALTYLEAGAFHRLSPNVCAHLSAWNTAVVIFLHHLPPHTRVVLWWH